MGLLEGEQAGGVRFLPGQIGHPINDLLPLFVCVFHLSAQAKDLCHPSLFGLKPGVHLRAGPEFSHFETTVSFVHTFGVLPLLVLGVWIFEEIHQVLMHLGGGWVPAPSSASSGCRRAPAHRPATCRSLAGHDRW
jgi:hypothetical protein